jgi:hypothetical protein
VEYILQLNDPSAISKDFFIRGIEDYDMAMGTFWTASATK